MTTTNIHKLNLGVNVAFHMRHAYRVRTDLEKFDLGPGKLLEFEKKVPFVQELSWNFVK